jgi:AbrB family looped-hinge helix DNA binding protein
MTTTIDGAGRIVIPKAIRRSVGLEPGAEVDVRAVDDVIEIRLCTRDVHLERRGSLLVAVPLTTGPELTQAAVDDTLAEVRFARAEEQP